jgi:hypothetical protein
MGGQPRRVGYELHLQVTDAYFLIDPVLFIYATASRLCSRYKYALSLYILRPKDHSDKAGFYLSQFSVFYCIEIFLVCRSVFHVGSACFQIQLLLLPNNVKPVNNIHCSLSTKYCVLIIHILSGG